MGGGGWWGGGGGGEGQISQGGEFPFSLGQTSRGHFSRGWGWGGGADFHRG